MQRISLSKEFPELFYVDPIGGGHYIQAWNPEIFAPNCWVERDRIFSTNFSNLDNFRFNGTLLDLKDLIIIYHEKT